MGIIQIVEVMSASMSMEDLCVLIASRKEMQYKESYCNTLIDIQWVRVRATVVRSMSFATLCKYPFCCNLYLDFTLVLLGLVGH